MRQRQRKGSFSVCLSAFLPKPPFFTLKNSFIATEGSCNWGRKKERTFLQGCSAESLSNYLSIAALLSCLAPLCVVELYCTRLSQPNTKYYEDVKMNPSNALLIGLLLPQPFLRLSVKDKITGEFCILHYKTSWWYGNQ